MSNFRINAIMNLSRIDDALNKVFKAELRGFPQ